MASFIRHWTNKSNHLVSDCDCNYDLTHRGLGGCEQTSSKCDGGKWCYIDGKSECPGARPSIIGAPWWWSCSCPESVIDLIDLVSRGSEPDRASGNAATSNHQQGQPLGPSYNQQPKQQICLRNCGGKLCVRKCWILTSNFCLLQT